MNFSSFIDLSKCRLKLIDNSKSLKGMDVLWSQYGGENKILANGPFFNMSTKKPLVHMKISGKVICKPNYMVWGIAWNDGEAPVWTVLPTNDYQNYFTNTVLRSNGKDTELTAHPDADGTRSKPRYTTRPMFGLGQDQFVFEMREKVSLWGLQKIAGEENLLDAIMGDGGASAAFRTPTHRKAPSRSIPYWILIEMVEDKKPEKDPSKPAKKEESKMVEVNAYSLKKDGQKKLAPNFKVCEFKCRDGSDTIFVAPKLVKVLQEIHDYFGTPVSVLSGYRTDAYNKKVEGAAYSQHKYGTAADIDVAGVSPKKAYDAAQKIMGNTGGIGLYKWGIHVDVRDVMARWNG